MIFKKLSRVLLCILCLFLHTTDAMETSSDLHTTQGIETGSDADDVDLELSYEQLMEQLYSEGFIDAAKNNNVTRVQELLLQGANVNVQNIESRHTALIVACMREDDTLALVTLLLNSKANPKLADSCLNTPFHYAAAGNKVAVLELLRKAGALLNAQNKVGSTACHFAIEKDALEALAWLSKAGAHMNMLNANGQAPVHQAILKGNVTTIHHLFKHGASLYVASSAAQEDNGVPAGSTPFHLVARNISEQGQALKSTLLYYALLYETRFEQTGIFEGHSLRERVENLRAVFKLKDSNNDTPYDIELKSNALTKTPILLFQDTLQLDMFNFNQALQNKTVEKLPSTNLFRAAYDAMPKKQGWGSYLLGWLPWK